MKKFIIIVIFLFSIIDAGIKAGKAFLEVIDNGDTSNIQIRFVAKTSFPFSTIYSIDDQIDTWLDIKKLHTNKIIKSINQGNYSKESETIIDYDNFISITNNDTIFINGYVYDPYCNFIFI